MAIGKPKLLVDYLGVGALSFVTFMLASPYLPGKHGLSKALLLDLGVVALTP